MRWLLLLSATAVMGFGQHAVNLSVQWQDDTADLSTGATVSILFQRATVSGGPYTTVGTMTASGARRTIYTYIDQASPSNPLIEGVTYYYVVKVQDSNGNAAALTPEVARTIPTVIKNRHLTAAVQ